MDCAPESKFGRILCAIWSHSTKPFRLKDRIPHVQMGGHFQPHFLGPSLVKIM
jgi:hypothetical protein